MITILLDKHTRSMVLKLKTNKVEYEPEGLIKLAERGSKWAIKELEHNGYCDVAPQDHGEEPRQRYE